MAASFRRMLRVIRALVLLQKHESTGLGRPFRHRLLASTFSLWLQVRLGLWPASSTPSENSSIACIRRRCCLFNDFRPEKTRTRYWRFAS